MDTFACESFTIHLIEAIRQTEKQFMLEFTFQVGKINLNYYDLPWRKIQVLVDARSNYIGIWVANTQKLRYNLMPEDFKFYSYHDSCWRTDGMKWIFENFISMRTELVNKIEDEQTTTITELNSAISMRPSSFFRHRVSFETRRDENGLPQIQDLKF